MEYRRKIKNKCNGRPKGVNNMIMEKNEYGEEIKYDGEWFYHSDIGKIKLVEAWVASKV